MFKSKAATSNEVDPSEYQPQVVELPPEESPVEGDEDPIGKDHNGSMTEETVDECGRGTLGDEKWSEDKRTQRWVEILEQMRKKHLAAMGDEDRQKILDRFEV